MKQFKTIEISLIVLLSIVLSPGVRGQEAETNQTPKTIEELRKGINGYYQTINPGTVPPPFNLPSFSATRVWTEGDTLYTQDPAHFGEIEKYVAVNDRLYQSLRTKRAEFIFVNDPLDGEVFELANVASGTLTFGSIPGAFLFARILVLILWILFILRAILLLPIWSFRYWRGKIPCGANVRIRIWPLLPVVFLLPYLGDILVVILIYCFIKYFLSLAIFTLAIFVLVFSFTIEFLQYFHIVEKLGLEKSKIARTVIGTSFAWMDLLADMAGIAIFWLLFFWGSKRKVT